MQESTPTWLLGPEVPIEARLGTVLAATFRLDALLGQGATGVTYNSWHLRQRSPHAIKLLHRDLSHTHAGTLRLRSDLRLLSNTPTLGVLQAELSFTAEGAPFLASDLLVGETLRRRLLREPLAPHFAGALVLALARAVSRVHDLGVVHGSLRPENVFLLQHAGPRGGAGEPVVLDAGLHHLLRRSADAKEPRHLPGLPYVAPEQASFEQLFADESGDLFAIGAILYECLTGQQAFPMADRSLLRGTVAQPLSRLALPAAAAPPGLAEALEEIITYACAPSPSLRYPSISAFGEALFSAYKKVGMPLPEARPPSAPAGRSPRRTAVQRRVEVQPAVAVLAEAPLDRPPAPETAVPAAPDPRRQARPTMRIRDLSRLVAAEDEEAIAAAAEEPNEEEGHAGREAAPALLESPVQVEAADAADAAAASAADAEWSRQTEEAARQAQREALERARAEMLGRMRAELEQADRERQARREVLRLEAERVLAEQREAERKEAERALAERREAAQKEAELLLAQEREEVEREAERLATEQQEAQRREAVERKAARVLALEKEAQRQEAERLAAEHALAERTLAERREAERVRFERLEAERFAAEKREAARKEAEEARRAKEAERLFALAKAEVERAAAKTERIAAAAREAEARAREAEARAREAAFEADLLRVEREGKARTLSRREAKEDAAIEDQPPQVTAPAPVEPPPQVTAPAPIEPPPPAPVPIPAPVQAPASVPALAPDRAPALAPVPAPVRTADPLPILIVPLEEERVRSDTTQLATIKRRRSSRARSSRSLLAGALLLVALIWIRALYLLFGPQAPAGPGAAATIPVPGPSAQTVRAPAPQEKRGAPQAAPPHRRPGRRRPAREAKVPGEGPHKSRSALAPGLKNPF